MVPKVVKFIKKVEWWGRAWGGRDKWGLLFNGYRVSVMRDEKSSRDWLHNRVNTLNTTELYPLKWLT